MPTAMPADGDASLGEGDDEQDFWDPDDTAVPKHAMYASEAASSEKASEDSAEPPPSTSGPPPSSPSKEEDEETSPDEADPSHDDLDSDPSEDEAEDNSTEPEDAEFDPTSEDAKGSSSTSTTASTTLVTPASSSKDVAKVRKKYKGTKDVHQNAHQIDAPSGLLSKQQKDARGSGGGIGSEQECGPDRPECPLHLECITRSPNGWRQAQENEAGHCEVPTIEKAAEEVLRVQALTNACGDSIANTTKQLKNDALENNLFGHEPEDDSELDKEKKDAEMYLDEIEIHAQELKKPEHHSMMKIGALVSKVMVARQAGKVPKIPQHKVTSAREKMKNACTNMGKRLDKINESYLKIKEIVDIISKGTKKEEDQKGLKEYKETLESAGYETQTMRLMLQGIKTVMKEKMKVMMEEEVDVDDDPSLLQDSDVKCPDTDGGSDDDDDFGLEDMEQGKKELTFKSSRAQHAYLLFRQMQNLMVASPMQIANSTAELKKSAKGLIYKKDHAGRKESFGHVLKKLAEKTQLLVPKMASLFGRGYKVMKRLHAHEGKEKGQAKEETKACIDKALERFNEDVGPVIKAWSETDAMSDVLLNMKELVSDEAKEREKTEPEFKAWKARLFESSLGVAEIKTMLLGSENVAHMVLDAVCNASNSCLVEEEDSLIDASRAGPRSESLSEDDVASAASDVSTRSGARAAPGGRKRDGREARSEKQGGSEKRGNREEEANLAREEESAGLLQSDAQDAEVIPHGLIRREQLG